MYIYVYIYSLYNQLHRPRSSQRLNTAQAVPRVSALNNSINFILRINKIMYYLANSIGRGRRTG